MDIFIQYTSVIIKMYHLKFKGQHFSGKPSKFVLPHHISIYKKKKGHVKKISRKYTTSHISLWILMPRLWIATGHLWIPSAHFNTPTWFNWADGVWRENVEDQQILRTFFIYKGMNIADRITFFIYIRAWILLNYVSVRVYIGFNLNDGKYSSYIKSGSTHK